MRTDKFTYAQCESALYEAMRTLIKKGKVQAEREGKALIDTTLSHLNESYVHECLKPFTHPPKRRNGKLYIMDENGGEVEYQRGQAIADYHNSQVKSKLQKARMNGTSEQLSKAMGFIVTLPKEYIQSVIPDISDAEYEYLVKKLEAEGQHQPFAKDEVYETSLAIKFSRHQWTDEEMEKAKEFLLASKDCVLDEMGIRVEDVLFWSIHFDESFPHIHCMALPTCEKTYDKDVFSGKKKKDGTYTLLHKKGDVDITYSIGKFYERGKDGEYTFFKDFHQNVVDRMTTKGFDASGLIQNVTSGKGFTPSQMDREQREESVRKAMEIAALQKKLKQVEAEKVEAISQRDTAQAEASACKTEVAKATEELLAKTELLEEKDLEIAEKEIELAEKEEQITTLRILIKELKEELATIVKEVALFVPRVVKEFFGAWQEAKIISQMEKVDDAAQAKALAGAEEMAKPLKELAKQAEALLEEDVVNGVNMATFTRTDQKIGFAKKQIQKQAEARGQAKAFQDDSYLIQIALQDWFNREKYEKEIERMSELDASLFMKNPTRAARAYEYAMEKEYEMEEMEHG